MRIAVISDTHMPRGARTLPAACVERLRVADLIVHAGDLVARSFLDELRALGPPVAAVWGNMDDAWLQEELPEERVVEADGARIGIVHVAGPREGRASRLVARFPDCGAVVYGHTHVPELTQHRGVWILNPGSPTERRSSPSRSMLELTVVAGELAPVLLEIGP